MWLILAPVAIAAYLFCARRPAARLGRRIQPSCRLVPCRLGYLRDCLFAAVLGDLREGSQLWIPRCGVELRRRRAGSAMRSGGAR